MSQRTSTDCTSASHKASTPDMQSPPVKALSLYLTNLLPGSPSLADHGLAAFESTVKMTSHSQHMQMDKNALVKGQVLMVATSHDKLGDSGQPTGLWLGELAEPYWVLKDAGYDITIASPAGGAVPIDDASLQGDFKTPECDRFLDDAEAKAVLQSTVKLDSIQSPEFYDCIFVPGGHGPMYDLAASELLGDILTKAAAAGKIISAVCHGPAGLVLAKGPDGSPLIKGKKMTGFTNSEEEAVGKTKMVPFLLEDKLKELGAHLTKADQDWGECVVTDGNLITGQNPGSARKLGHVLLEALNSRRAGSGASGGVTVTAAEAGLVKQGAAATAIDSDTAAQRDTGLTDAGKCC